MPELPEVETVRRVLSRQLLGLSITDIKINYEKMILCDINYFKKSLIGHKFIDIKRKGKALIFHLDDIYLISHLRMEGKYYYKNIDDEILKHEHVVFYLSNGMTLRYHDTRKFGIMTLKSEDELYTTPPLNDIGPEPWECDGAYLYAKLHTKTIAIKTSLLDQSIISGLGNIYVDEVLFKTHINPHKKSCDINEEDCRNIIKYSRQILECSIKCGGTTIRSYTSSLGVRGGYQDNLCVHTKDICPICKNKITKDKVGGRGSYYCNKCQHL